MHSGSVVEEVEGELRAVKDWLDGGMVFSRSLQEPVFLGVFINGGRWQVG